MSRGRVRAALIVVGGAGALLMGTSAPALAATQSAPSISAPSVVTSRSDVSISANITSPKGGSLTLSRGGTANTAATATTAKTLGCTIDAAAGGCGWSGVLANGSYTVTAVNAAYTQTSGCGGLTQPSCQSYDQAASTSTLTLKVPPAAPANVQTTATGDRDIRVSWDPNAEPDITSYDLLDGSSATLISQITCDGTDCHVDLSYPADDPGGAKDFRVRAWRSDGAGGQVKSSASATSSVTLPAPATASTGGSGGGTSGGGSTGGSSGGGSSTGGSSGGGTSTGGGDASGAGSGGVVDNSGSGSGSGPGFTGYSGKPGLGLKFSTSGGGITLPTLPGGNPNPNVAIPEGTYGKTLGYKDQVDSQKVREQTLSTRLVTTFSAFTDGDRIWKSLAGALVLVLVGMHLRVWTRSAAYE